MHAQRDAALYRQTTRTRPLPEVSFRHEIGRDGSERAKGGFTSVGFHACTLAPGGGARLAAGDGAAEATAGSGSGGSCWKDGLVYDGLGCAGGPKPPGSDIGLASTTEPSDVRVQPEDIPPHTIAATGSQTSLPILPE